MKIIQLKKEWCGYLIEATMTLLKEDIHILLVGGSLPHTGAVAMYCNGISEGLLQPQGHKDGVVAERWAKTFSEVFHGRATVVCGIHYDELSKEQIAEIVSLTDEMLLDAIAESEAKRVLPQPVN